MITLRGVVKRFGRQTVLDGFDLDLREGEKLAIIGPSGCGKSTLLRIMMTLLEPDEGRVEFRGQDIFALAEPERLELRSQFGMVFQHSALFDSLSVEQNVGFFLRERLHMSEPQVRQRVAEKLALVGLSGKSAMMPAELSGGMQKRVSFARAIAHDPKIILYDEPTTGLDPQLSTAIENLMNTLSDTLSMTSVVVTHQISTVHRTAERVVFVQEGRPIDVGSPAAAQHSPVDVVRRFMAGDLP